MKKILLVEDEREIMNVLKEVLQAQDYSLRLAYDGLEAFHIYQNEKIDLIITDLMMPNLNGSTFIEMIRKDNPLIPIIAITAFSSEDRAIEILKLGADDFLEKPFSIPILIQKVERLLKKDEYFVNDSESESDLVTKHLDSSTRSYLLNGTRYELTSKEFDILKKLIENEGAVVSREDIVKVIWDDEKVHSLRNVDNHIRNIRKKIPGIRIQTHSKMGYRFVL